MLVLTLVAEAYIRSPGWRPEAIPGFEPWLEAIPGFEPRLEAIPGLPCLQNSLSLSAGRV